MKIGSVVSDAFLRTESILFSNMQIMHSVTVKNASEG